ncbi:MAG: efflux RND transporter periplasmic adaptor subunit [Candidatus Schekmanbacteria bacterium]|nr:efflux RND transporter periplasmic adaptor subunit [Candidatus Schekmanbacteria bacterium]
MQSRSGHFIYINNLRKHHSAFLLLIACFGVLSVLFFTGCSSKTKDETNRQRIVAVTVAKAVSKDVPVTINAIGTVETISSVTIKTLVSGELMTVHFKEGDDVKKGALLFSIDPRPFKAALNQAEANLAKDKAQLQNSATEEERYKSLFEKGFIARENYDSSRTNREMLEASVQSDRATIDNAKILLGYCSIYSPIEGRTGNLDVKAGNIVKVNDTSLVTINKISPILVTFSVPEQNLSAIKKNISSGTLKVEALIPNDGQTPEEGELTFIDNAVDTATGTIRLKGTFENPAKSLWPGQFVNTTLVLSTEKNAIVIPSESVQSGQKGEYVFVVKPDMTVDSRPVKVIRTTGNESLIGNGISAGETVVTDGQLQLLPGTKVQIKSSSATPQNQP